MGTSHLLVIYLLQSSGRETECQATGKVGKRVIAPWVNLRKVQRLEKSKCTETTYHGSSRGKAELVG